MVFSSPLFLGMFLPIVLIGYLAINRKLRSYFLLVFSVFFYAWGEPQAVFVMLGLMIVNYLLGLALMVSSRCARGMVLFFGVAIDLLALIGYKYLGFIGENLGYLGVELNIPAIALPIGISFYVFQLISYLIDVQRREVAPQRNPFYFMLYVSFFPQLIAGPIVRYSTIAAEMADRTTNAENISSGLMRFVIGLAKKVLIADNMALVADSIFKCDVAAIPCVYCWIGAIAYTLQIYYDFSGYSDMAIGLGRVFNFHFLENFDYPYSATSIRDFWRRWHISLSSWFRDYLYIPLGGNRKGLIRTYVNMFLVFSLCGVWHGASWNFVVWGIYHGGGLVVERLVSGRIRWQPPVILSRFYVLLFVIVGWVFFRAETLSYACDFLHTMFVGNLFLADATFPPVLDFLSISNAAVLIVGLVLSFPWHIGLIRRVPVCARYMGIGVLALVVVAYAMTSGYSPFIYFRF